MNVEIKDDKQNPFNLANRMYYVFKDCMMKTIR